MAHWKTFFDYKHLGVQDLPQNPNKTYQDIIVTILVLEKREVVTEGGKKEMLAVADLKGASKPMIVNKSNFRILEGLFNTTEWPDYVGKTVQIYAAKVRGKAGGIVDGLRIRDKAPATVKPDFNPNNPKWNAIKEAIKNKEYTIEQILETRSISAENLKLLTS